MKFSQFDQRNYPTLTVEDGYGAWSRTYDDTVLDLLNLRLLARIRTINWGQVGRAMDLACGTGRIGAWLREQGVARVDGVDLTPEMLTRAEQRGVYHSLSRADVRRTGAASGDYDLCCMVLADEHLPDLAPLYAEAARLLAPGGHFINVGYHPFHQMQGIPTHFHGEDGRATAIESYVHQVSDQFQAGRAAGLALEELDENIIDEEWLAAKPQWQRHLHRPLSFMAVWRKPPAGSAVPIRPEEG